MIFELIESRLPTELKEAKIWTFTRTDYSETQGKDLKTPMDPIQLDLGAYVGIADPSHLLTFEQLKLVRNVPDHWLPAFQLNAYTNGWAMVDIEPAGMTSDNPYFKVPYAYTEASRHDGFHGLIKLDTSFPFMTKTVVKLHKFETEVLLNNHFVTLTGKEPSTLYQPTNVDLNIVSEGIAQFASASEATIENQTNVTLDSMQEPLSKPAQALFDKLNIKPLVRPKGVDISEWEFSNLVQKFNGLYRHHYTEMKALTTDDKVALLYRAAQKALPYRKKHDRPSNDLNHGDRVTYLFYIVRRIVETN